MARSTSRLTVGFDQRLAAYRHGGIARYTTELSRALARLPDLDVRRLLHESDESATGRDIILRTPAHHRLETYAIGVELALGRHSLDVYHATDFVAPRLTRCPVVATIHDLAFMRWPDHLSRDALAYYRQVRRQAGRTARWITPSEWTRSELVDLVGIPESDITVIPHGVSSFIAPGEIVPREGRKPYVIAVGTVEPRKRYSLLLDAFDGMRPRPELVIVGAAGWNTGDLQQRLQSTESVRWLDRASDAEINELLSNALLLAIPSLAEGFGLGALEAMARGTPVVSSGLGALSEVTGGAAVVPDHDDPDSWAGAIELVIEDEQLWRRCSDAGVQRAEQFTWEEAAYRTADVYHEVAG